MFVQSSRVAVHGIIAIICGNLSGLFMGFDKSFLSCGLFGYNSFLVGLAIATFESAETHRGYNWSAVIGAIISSYVSSVLFVMLGKILAPYKVSLRNFNLGVCNEAPSNLSDLEVAVEYLHSDTTFYVALQYQHFGILDGNEADYQKQSR